MTKEQNKSSFSDRLRSERARLGLTQDEFASLAGVSRGAQVKYERGDRRPDSDYLTAISANVDINYLLKMGQLERAPTEVLDNFQGTSRATNAPSTFAERLRLERQKLGLNQTEFADWAGVSLSAQSNYEKGGRHPDAKYLTTISSKVDVHFLINGFTLTPGDKLSNAVERAGLSQTEVAEALGITREQQIKYESGIGMPDTDYLQKAEALLKAPGLADVFKKAYKTPEAITEQFSLIPRYDVAASAGSGAQVFDEEIHQTLAFRKVWLSARGLQVDKLSIIEVAGDSMAPRLQSGDLVLLNHVDTAPKSGNAYVIRVGDELMVKYVQLLPNEKIQFSSENPTYPPYTVGIGDVTIIGRVVSSSHEW